MTATGNVLLVSEEHNRRGKTMTENITREEWLHKAIEAFRPKFEAIDFPIPAQIHVSVGFGYGAKRESGTILGQCWARCASDDGVNHIFISPEMNDSARVLDVLIHELIHAADDCKSGHKGDFEKAAKALGLTGKMTATVASDELREAMTVLAEELGPYAHATLFPMGKPLPPQAPEPGAEVPAGTVPKIHSGPKKQGTRMVKLVCAHADCECGGYTVRTTEKWIAIGMPSCPAQRKMSRG
jgi:hypothetical protein